MLLLFAQFQILCDPFHLMVCVACVGLDSDLNAFVQLLRIGHIQTVGGIQHDVCIRHAAQRKGGESGCRQAVQNIISGILGAVGQRSSLVRQILVAHAVDGGLGGDVDIQSAAIPDLGNGKGLVYGKFGGAVCISDGVHVRRSTAFRLLDEPAAVHGAAVKGDSIHEVAVADLDALAGDDLAADKAGEGLKIAAVGHGQGVGVFIVAPVLAGVNALGIGLHAGGVRQAVHDAQLRLELNLEGYLQRFGDVVAQVAGTGHTGFGISGIARAGQGDDRLVAARLGGIHRGRRSIRVGRIHVLHGVNNGTIDLALRLIGGNGQVGGVHLQDGQEGAVHAVLAVRNGAIQRLLKVRLADIIDTGVLLFATEGIDEIPSIERMRIRADIIANEQERVALTVQRVDRIQGGKAGSIRLCEAVEGCILRNRQHHGGQSSLRLVQEQAACDAAGAGDGAGKEAAVQRAVVDDIALDGRTLSKLRGGVGIDGQGVVLIVHALCICGDHRCAVFVNGQVDDRGSRSGLLHGHLDVQRFGDEVVQIALQSNAVDQVLLLFGQCGNAVICKQSRCGNDGILACEGIPIAVTLERNLCHIIARNSGIGSKGFSGGSVGVGDTGGFDLGDGDVDLAGGIDAQIAAVHVSDRCVGRNSVIKLFRQSGTDGGDHRPVSRHRTITRSLETGRGHCDQPAKRFAAGVAVACSGLGITPLAGTHNVQRSGAGRILQAAESSTGGEGEFDGISILRLVDKHAAFNNALVGDSTGEDTAVQLAFIDDVALDDIIDAEMHDEFRIDRQYAICIFHTGSTGRNHRLTVFVNGQVDGAGNGPVSPSVRGQFLRRIDLIIYVAALDAVQIFVIAGILNRKPDGDLILTGFSGAGRHSLGAFDAIGDTVIDQSGRDAAAGRKLVAQDNSALFKKQVSCGDIQHRGQRSIGYKCRMRFFTVGDGAGAGKRQFCVIRRALEIGCPQKHLDIRLGSIVVAPGGTHVDAPGHNAVAIGRSEIQLCCGCGVLVDHIDSVIDGVVENAACAAQFVRTVNTGIIYAIGRVGFTQRSGRNCTLSQNGCFRKNGNGCCTQHHAARQHETENASSKPHKKPPVKK